MLQDNLTGALLVAMPNMSDTRFSQSVIYVCGHDENGAMGLVINKPLESHAVHDLLEQLNIAPITVDLTQQSVYIGGPIEMGRGFVLHSGDFTRNGTLAISNEIYLSATLEILMAMAEGTGPEKTLCILGYAGWMAGQLENEIQQNVWIVLPQPDMGLLFDVPAQSRWQEAFERLGIHPELLSLDTGHA
ncbi:MAG: YqgE/AlgH family protein [Proteobacteria bacterium]|nr:YqgE/AlgH family protein [Pseudomonadota bacterium]